MTTHPTLYKKTSTGAIALWQIRVEGTTIITTHGQVDGAMQEARDTIASGKNVGKKNATTAEQQAEAEAAAKWTKQLKKGYVQSIEAAQAGEVDDVITGGVSPMLAHKHRDHAAKIKYPCFTQPKLDGHRCVAVVEADGEVTLWSRTRKPITGMPHISDAIRSLDLPVGTVLDGELYSHAHKADFDTLTSLIRSSTPKDGHEVMEYHIYDLPSSEATFQERTTLLDNVLCFTDGSPRHVKLVYVMTEQVDNDDELMEAFDRYVADGYEGSMARNALSKYENKRSYGLQKIKEFDDGDFEVVGVEEGRGKLAGHAIFVCKTADGTEFRVKMKGDTAELKQYWDDPSLAIGRLLEVKYFGLTGKNSVPRFPIAHRFKVAL
jgi:DNA ligase-1